MRLQGKTAIVTGGGTGIGRAIATKFAAEGADVAICGRRQEMLEGVAKLIGGEHILACKADVSSEQETKEFVAKVIARFGKIDILVNNAGINLSKDILSTSGQEFDQIISVDLKGIFFMSKAVISHMIERNSGKIVNIASIAGLVAFGRQGIYSAAKGAVISLTREMAMDYGKNKINVNAIAPGIINTDMTSGLSENEERKKLILMQTPIGRIGEPDDIANAALFFASNESDFITGQTIIVDGGWTIH